jgi:hypothetical protein
MKFHTGIRRPAVSGTDELLAAVKKAYQLRPEVSASCALVATRFVNLTFNEMYQLHPKVSASCVP